MNEPAVQPLTPFFPKILYYCVNQISDAGCVRSLDGGLTLIPTATPPYAEPVTTDPLAICSSLHGHGASDSAGRIFLPRGCNVPQVAISEDGGDTWTRVNVSNTIGADDRQTSVAVDTADNVYYAWWDDKHRLPYLSISRDHGKTWSTPLMIAPPDVHEVNWPTVIAGDPGKIAITFPGTTSSDSTDPHPAVERLRRDLDERAGGKPAVPVEHRQSRERPDPSRRLPVAVRPHVRLPRRGHLADRRVGVGVVRGHVHAHGLERGRHELQHGARRRLQRRDRFARRLR
jgi:hypothetical protein